MQLRDVWPFSWWVALFRPIGFFKQRGEGRYVRFRINPVFYTSLPKMKKTWNSAFEGTDLTTNKGSEFEDSINNTYGTTIGPLEGVKAYQIVEYFRKRKGKCGFEVEDVEDVTEHYLDKIHLKEERERLKSEIRVAENKGKIEEAKEKKLQLEELNSRFSRLTLFF